MEHTSYTPVKRFFLEISFDGSNYQGWQSQPHNATVQQTIEKTLQKIYNVPISIIGSSRTDAGVHAKGFVASFLLPERPVLTTDKLKHAMNQLLPADVKLCNVKEVPMQFHARYNALGKAYSYVLNLGEPSPFLNKYSWKAPHKIDVEKIKLGANILTGTHDFSSFVVKRSLIDDAVRTIHRIDVQNFGDFCVITYIGNSFLYKMIRCLTGMLESVGAGLASVEETKYILECCDRNIAPETAPAHGLFLMKVFYEPNEYKEFTLKSLPFL